MSLQKYITNGKIVKGIPRQRTGFEAIFPVSPLTVLNVDIGGIQKKRTMFSFNEEVAEILHHEKQESFRV